MDEEIRGIFDLDTFTLKKECGFSVYKSKDLQKIIIETGIGKSNAAAAAQFALQNYPASQYINTGLVGAFNKSLQLGQVIQVLKCRFFDVDVTPFGYALGQLPKCTLVEYPISQKKIKNTEITPVFLVSGDTFLNKSELREKIIRDLSPDVVDMELASIAHIFYLHGKLASLTSIKVISDYADQSSHLDFYDLMKQALTNLRKYIHGKTK